MIEQAMAEKLKIGEMLADQRGQVFVITGIQHEVSAPKGKHWKFSLSTRDGRYTFIHEMHFDRMSVLQTTQTPKESIPVVEKPVETAKAKKRR